ncbi:MAG: hypothetical protein AAB900_00165, partial [Patescibacteria group bacterium]
MSKEEIESVRIDQEPVNNSSIGSVENGNESSTSAHAEAVNFVEEHRDFFEHYARGRVKFAPAPAGLSTFTFDLKTDTIYINSKFYEELGFSKEKTSFATLHEIEHFLEKIQLLAEAGGEEQFEQYLKIIGESKAFSLMDNCLADVRENRTVVEKTHQGFRNIEEKCYREDLFKETDFTAEPRHIQFNYALLREARVLGEECTVAPEVRQEIDALKAIVGSDGSNLFDVMTDPETSMSIRLKLQDKFVWPIVKRLLAEDMAEQKERKEKGSGEGEGLENEGGEGGESDEEDKKDQAGEGEGESPEKKTGQKGNKKGEKKAGEKTGNQEAEADPDAIFKEAYDRADKKVPPGVSLKEIKKAFDDWREEQRENPLEKADKEYANKLGVKKEDLQKYRQTVELLGNIINPETNETVIEELRALISKIIAKRLKPQPAPQYPVIEGEDLVDPAQLVADVKSGNLEPKVWETFEMREKRSKKFGEVEITLVCDRSTSMDEDGGAKKHEQQKAAVLLMEALKD